MIHKKKQIFIPNENWVKLLLISKAEKSLLDLIYSLNSTGTHTYL